MNIRYLTMLCCSFLLFSCEIEPLDNLDATSLKSNGNDEVESGGCQTLFAKGDDDQSTCFIEDGFKRWGWTIGPLSGGDHSFDLYAAAGQCDTEKGALVGSLSINYDDVSGTAEVSYELSDGYSLGETHLYIGNDPYPTGKNGNPTVSPGQFPNKHDGLEGVGSDSYTVTNLSGEIYVIAHGVVCEDSDSDDDDETDGDDGTDDGNTDDDDGGLGTPT